MTSRERMALAMAHGNPDRVPVMCQLALGHYFLHCGRPHEIWFDSESFARALLDRQRAYRFDGILVNLPGRPPDWRNHLREVAADGQRLLWDDDVATTVPPDDNPQSKQTDGSPLPRPAFETFDPADRAAYFAPGYLWGVYHAPALWGVPRDADLSRPDTYPDWFTRTLRRVRDAAPDVSVHGEVFSPFTHLLELFGYEAALMGLLMDPARCHATLDQLSRIVIAQVELQAACQPDAILISSAFAGAGFVSREMYAEFVVPYERRVHEAIHAHGLPGYVHTCGAIGERLDLMAETRTDGIDTLDPKPLGTVDLAEAKAGVGQRLWLKGNLDSVNELLRGDDATFERAVRERLEIGKPGGGYILSTACSVAPRVRPQRLARLVELAEELGRY